MILKIYLLISILTLIMFHINTMSVECRIKNKYGKNIYNNVFSANVFNTIFTYLKILIICFLPIYQIFMLFVLLFVPDFENRCYEKSEEEIERYNLNVNEVQNENL